MAALLSDSTRSGPPTRLKMKTSALASPWAIDEPGGSRPEALPKTVSLPSAITLTVAGKRCELGWDEPPCPSDFGYVFNTLPVTGYVAALVLPPRAFIKDVSDVGHGPTLRTPLPGFVSCKEGSLPRRAVM